MDFAALLGDGVYDIGELLAHPIFESLRGTEYEWLADLLQAFNAGDIGKFESMKPQWAQMADLSAQETTLRQKISLLCLMEMTFKRPANNRIILFDEIAKETHNEGTCTGLSVRSNRSSIGCSQYDLGPAACVESRSSVGNGQYIRCLDKFNYEHGAID